MLFRDLFVTLVKALKKILSYIFHTTWARILSVMLFFFLLMELMDQDKTMKGQVRSISLFMGIFVWVIFNNRVLIERLLLKGRLLLYFPTLLLGISAFACLQALLSKEPVTSSRWLAFYFYSFMNTFLAGICYFSFKYLKEQRSILHNKLIMAEMEQNYLKAQLNPHFLFNALNNIYSHSFHKSPNTNELILKLSELMRYILEFNKREKIMLREEISFIENYLAFEKERLSERCEIHFLYEIQDPDSQIEPLLFFPFIENAFKHGTNTMRQTSISIHISQAGKRIRVTVDNELTEEVSSSTKTGIVNARKRLFLLYPEKYTLEMKKENGRYLVNLELTAHD